MALPERSTVAVTVGGGDLSEDVVYAQTTFTLSASAQPGTARIKVRDPGTLYSFTEGSIIELKIDGKRMWRGYLFEVEMGYEFEDDASVRMWTLGGVDLNILLDKLIMYNHLHPTRYPDGGGAYKRRKVVDPKSGTSGGFQIHIPKYTYDGSYIKTMLNDFDVGLVSPSIKKNRIGSVGQINPDGKFTPPGSGTTLRSFMEDVSKSVNRSQPGSTIFYIDPDAYLVYVAQDTALAPFWVGDSNPSQTINGVTGENVRGVRYRSGISSLKNDVLIFSGELDQRPESKQKLLKYSHRIDQDSVDAHGRFQYSEVVKGSFTQSRVNARANKIINQEGTPGASLEFVTFRPGLYPGQVIWVDLTSHSLLENLPIRSISMSFPQQDIIEYRVSCSYSTQDPWGMLMALKREADRGLRIPDVLVVDLRLNPNQTLDPAQDNVLVKEFPHSLGNNTYQCSYGYIRNSASVYVDGARLLDLQNPTSGSVGFQQTSPSDGQFQLANAVTGGAQVYVEYNVSGEL
jgi:hypothetical protein